MKTRGLLMVAVLLFSTFALVPNASGHPRRGDEDRRSQSHEARRARERRNAARCETQRKKKDRHAAKKNRCVSKKRKRAPRRSTRRSVRRPTPAPVPAPPPPAPRPEPQVVVAHIDSGINPYHEAFRDTSPLAYVHPSNYIPGYPADVPALHLTLDAPSWQEAFARDKPIWDDLLKRWSDTRQRATVAGQMYWIPGTRIVGAVRLGTGGVYCPTGHSALQPAPYPVHDCPDYPILDDHGHGTMTASRMAGAGTSLCEECRILSIEGLGDLSVKFAADQGWVDVQTNSWGYIVPHPVVWALDYLEPTFEPTRNMEEAARKHLVYFASGNGLGFFLGGTTWPSELATTLVKNSVWVGAHDNGKVAAWSGAPAHLVADGYRGLTAGNRTTSGVEPSPFSCCTSAASPYAAGQGAAIVLEARRLLGDPSTGVRNGIVAEGSPPAGVTAGPLADGALTLDELRAIVKHTAEARPRQGRHDGRNHWSGDPRVPEVLPYGPGDNAFCNGCWTMPISWGQVPSNTPAHVLIGYGAANEFSLELARRVLAGTAAAPDRRDVDRFFEDEAKLRDLVHHPEQFLPPPP